MEVWQSGSEKLFSVEHLKANYSKLSVHSRLFVDVALLVLTVTITGFFAIEYDSLEALIEWSERYEEYEIDEIFTVLIILSVALLVFTYRRLTELRNEINQRNLAENRYRHLALHDPLTSLPNRVEFQNRLKFELERSSRDGTQVAVLAIDLDHFKQVNDVYGHAVGDDFLRPVSERFLDSTRQTDTVARLGGDEFVILQPGLKQPNKASHLANRLNEVLAAPLEIQGQLIVSSVSIGISISSSEISDASELLRSADIALYRAKANGRSTHRFFENEMDVALQQRKELEMNLREAVANESFTLHYQPLMKVSSRQLIGFEALIRWNHSKHGNIPPEAFIPLAEETGLIIAIGDWVLDKACREALKWDGEYKLAVNISPAQFKHRDLPSKVKATLERTGFPAERLELEITESILISDTDIALSMLQELKEFGVRISMDDFGTGYSSLSYLKQFSFDKIKIDRSFVSQLEDNPDDAAIIRAILSMGQSLGMVATAEGVETNEQLRYLLDEGCDEAQGFLLGKPMDFLHAKELSKQATLGKTL